VNLVRDNSKTEVLPIPSKILGKYPRNNMPGKTKVIPKGSGNPVYMHAHYHTGFKKGDCNELIFKKAINVTSQIFEKDKKINFWEFRDGMLYFTEKDLRKCTVDSLIPASELRSLFASERPLMVTSIQIGFRVQDYVVKDPTRKVVRTIAKNVIFSLFPFTVMDTLIFHQNCYFSKDNQQETDIPRLIEEVRNRLEEFGDEVDDGTIARFIFKNNSLTSSQQVSVLNLLGLTEDELKEVISLEKGEKEKSLQEMISCMKDEEMVIDEEEKEVESVEEKKEEKEGGYMVPNSYRKNNKIDGLREMRKRKAEGMVDNESAGPVYNRGKIVVPNSKEPRWKNLEQSNDENDNQGIPYIPIEKVRSFRSKKKDGLSAAVEKFASFKVNEVVDDDGQNFKEVRFDDITHTDIYVEEDFDIVGEGKKFIKMLLEKGEKLDNSTLSDSNVSKYYSADEKRVLVLLFSKLY